MGLLKEVLHTKVVKIVLGVVVGGGVIYAFTRTPAPPNSGTLPPNTPGNEPGAPAQGHTSPSSYADNGESCRRNIGEEPPKHIVVDGQVFDNPIGCALWYELSMFTHYKDIDWSTQGQGVEVTGKINEGTPNEQQVRGHVVLEGCVLDQTSKTFVDSPSALSFRQGISCNMD